MVKRLVLKRLKRLSLKLQQFIENAFNSMKAEFFLPVFGIITAPHFTPYFA